jgi:hypothetical protein
MNPQASVYFNVEVAGEFKSPGVVVLETSFHPRRELELPPEMRRFYALTSDFKTLPCPVGSILAADC